MGGVRRHDGGRVGREPVRGREVALTPPPLPDELQVEVTAACNLRCRMCLVRYRPPVDRVTGSMAPDMVVRLLDELPTVRRLTLQGLGEPLLAPSLFEIIDAARERGIEVGFNTNGTLLRAATCDRLIDAGVAWLHVSVDGATAPTFEHIRVGARFEKVVRNLRTLLERKRARGVDHPRVQLNVVAMRSNIHELSDLVRLAGRLGVDRCWVQNLSHDFSDTTDAGPYAEIRTFVRDEEVAPDCAEFAEARRVADAEGLELRLPAPRPTRTPAPSGLPCDWPWHRAYVNHDGRVQPCCMLMGEDRAVLGDLREHSFADIWAGADYERFREQLLGDTPPEPCRGCAVYRSTF